MKKHKVCCKYFNVFFFFQNNVLNSILLLIYCFSVRLNRMFLFVSNKLWQRGEDEGHHSRVRTPHTFCIKENLIRQLLSVTFEM